MKIGKYDIKPIAIHIPDTPQWVERKNNAEQHFKERGVEDIFWLTGIYWKTFQIKGTGIYLLDNKPEEEFYVGNANVANFLTQYCAYVVMDALGYSHFMYLEDDCRMVEGWKEKLEQQMQYVPDDFDFLFIGSCCAKGKQPIHLGGDVYEFPYRGEQMWNWYPMATHNYLISKKCIKHVITTQRDTASPTDVSLVKHSFPKMKVIAILPRLSDQFDTNLVE